MTDKHPQLTWVTHAYRCTHTCTHIDRTVVQNPVIQHKNQFWWPDIKFRKKSNVWPPDLVFVMDDWTLHKLFTAMYMCTCMHTSPV